MSVVIDSSALVAALIDTGAEGLWAESILGAGDLYSAELLPAEVSKILRRLERTQIITRPEANAAHDELMRLPIELVAFQPVAERVWELRFTMTAYDAWYVAVAEALRLPLATLDGKLTRASGAQCEFRMPDQQ
jgi:predicted nucleic acid-binding protein